MKWADQMEHLLGILEESYSNIGTLIGQHWKSHIAGGD